MNKNEQRKIEKDLINQVENTAPGTAEHKVALLELLKFIEASEEARKNKASEELDQQKIDNEAEKQEVEKQKIASQEATIKIQIDLEEKKLQQQREIAANQNQIDKEKIQVEKKVGRWNFIGNIISVVGSIFGGILGSVVAWKNYDKMADKAYKFEETGTVASFTSKQVLSNGMKPPKK